MNQAELTPVQGAGYDGFMDPSAAEQPTQPEAPTPAVESLQQVVDSGREETEAPANANAEAEMQRRNKELVNSKRTTQQFLREMAEKLKKPDVAAGEVRADADKLIYAARMIKSKLQGQELENFLNTKILEQAEQLAQSMDQARRNIGIDAGDAGALKAAGERLDREMQARAGSVANLALAITPYFEKDIIAQQEKDPYKPILSFEELMTKFLPVAGEKFQQGGEFPLIEVSVEVDEFGREIIREEAHPENFMQYIREKAEFYHDFDPFKPINLFQNLYLTLGFRTASVYELLVDFPQYFYKRQETFGDLLVNINEVEQSGNFTPIKDAGDQVGDLVGHYVIPDNGTGQKKQLNVRVLRVDPETGKPIWFKVFEVVKNSDGSETEMPYQAQLADMDARQTKENAGYTYVREELLYDVWLFNEWHNNDISYRQNGMPTESELKKVMAEICSLNIISHTRKRLLGDLRRPSIEEVKTALYSPDAEVERKKLESGEKQGSVGKAQQRAISVYYHLAEANAYMIDDKTGKPKYIIDGENPFEQLLRTSDFAAAQYFYKGLIKATIAGEYGQYEDKLSPVVKEIMDLVNGKRDEWQNLDLIDLLVSGKEDLRRELQRRGKTQAFDDAVKKLQEKYSVGSNERELLDLLVNGTAQKKRRYFVDIIQPMNKSLLTHQFINSSGMEGLEDFALKFLVSTFDKEYTADANVYMHINYSQRAKERVKQAIRDAIQQTERITGFEAKYAEERAFAMSYFLGCSARNDMNGIGHDAWSKILNTEYYRLRQTSGGNYPGNLENLYGIHRLGVDMLQGLKVQREGTNKLDKTLYEMITGFNGRDYNGINRSLQTFDFHSNAMRQFYADHLDHAIDLFTDITKGHEFNIDKIVKLEPTGRVLIDHHEMQKLIDSTWKHMRYGFDNRGFLYDNVLYGWWQEEFLKENGQVSRTPHFGAKRLRNLMFSDEVNAMRMYERRDNSSWSGEDVYHSKMGRNIFAYLVKAQLEEHTKRSDTATLYTADQVALISKALINYASRVMKGEHGESLVLSGFFTPEEMYRILFFAHAILWHLYAKEYGLDVAGGFFAGLFQAFSMVMKEIGAGITLKS